MDKQLQVGFYVRNAFQVSHLRPLFRAVPGAVWLLSSASEALAFGIADEMWIASLFLRRKMEKFDVVVSHAGPPRGKPLRRAKFVMVQYGYAKEPYNYGDWRGAADAILAYGPYAVERFSQSAPAYAIGNPRWDDWVSDGFLERARAALPVLDPTKPIVLYAPTWGALSSLTQWTATVSALARNYTVLVKAHHNSIRDGQLEFTTTHANLHDVSHVDLMDALAVSDVVISDYSGAIFDGIMCRKPVLLLDVTGIEGKFGSKMDAQSIEVSRREELGDVVSELTQLGPAVAHALQSVPDISPALDAALFVRPNTVGQTFVDFLPQIVES